MDSDKILKLSKRAYEPYFKEALHCFQIWVLVSLACVCVSVAISVYANVNLLPFVAAFIALYALADCILNYRLSFLALAESKKETWDIDEFEITEISEDPSWAGHWWESTVSRLYPKDLRVERYKLKCRTASGEIKALRAAMSGKKYQIISDRIFNLQPTKCKIRYGKHSRIIIHYASGGEWTDTLNHLF